MEATTPQETQEAPAIASATSTTSTPNQEREELRAARTPLQRLQGALRRRFGSDILMRSAANSEATGSNSEAHRLQETAMVLQDKS